MGMGLEDLKQALTVIERQIEALLKRLKYPECNDLSILCDYKQIKSADDKQLLEEYHRILDNLYEVQNTIVYYEHPVKEISYLHLDETGRYVTASGYCYGNGSIIEFLRTDNDHNHDIKESEGIKIWTRSRVEYDGQNYFILDYPDINLSGLMVRVR